MKYLLTGVAAITMLTACGQKDKPEDTAGAPGIVFPDNKGPAYRVQDGDAATAAQALAAMALETSGSGNVSWAGRDLNGDKAVFTDVTLLSAPGDDGMTLEANDDGIDFEGADLKLAKLELDGLAMKDGAPSFARLVMSNVQIVPTDEDEAEQGSGTVGSIELVNPSPETAAWVASLFADDGDHELPEGAALSFDHWAMTDIDFRIDEPEGDKGTFTVGSIEVNGLKDQKAALMKLGNMSFDMTDTVENTDMKLNLGSIEMHGADLKLLTDASEDATDPEDVSRMMNLAGQDPANPGYDSLSIHGFDMDLAGVKVALPDLVSSVGRDKKGGVVAVKTDPFKVSLSTGEGKYGEELGGQLAMLGYEKLELTAAGYQTYDAASDLTTYVKGRNFWELKDGFRIDFGMAYAGAKAMAAAEQGGSGDPTDGFSSAMDKMVLHGMELSIDDNGFLDRALNAYATQSGQDPQEMRNQLSAMIVGMGPMMAMGSGIDATLATEASSALSSFVTEPKTLTIKLAPAEPLALSTLENMEDPSLLTKESLGFSATNE